MERQIFLLIIIIACLYLIIDDYYGNHWITRFSLLMSGYSKEAAGF